MNMEERWIDLLFEDEEGEPFFVEIKIDPKATDEEKVEAAGRELRERYGMDVRDYAYICEYTDREADMLGYDTY